MADKRRNTTTLLHGRQTKDLFVMTAGLAAKGVSDQNMREASIERPDLQGTAQNAASRIQNNPASLIRGEQANVTPMSDEKSKEKDTGAKKKTPQWTNSFRIG